MTTATEQRYLLEYSRRRFTGAGHIVDLGCWLGSTTIPLAKGLRANTAIACGRKIFAYDLFIWFDWMNETIEGTDLDGRFSEGDSFVGEFRNRIAGNEDIVIVREEDLTTTEWSDGPIEFLLVDAMKSLELTNAIARSFFPSLLEGDGLLFHQDFAHFHTPWIHVLQWQLRDWFAFEAEVPGSTSVVFRCTKAMSPQDIPDLQFSSVTMRELDAAFDHSFSMVSSDKHPNIAAAKIMWFAHQENYSRARDELDKITRSGIPVIDDLAVVSAMMSERI